MNLFPCIFLAAAFLWPNVLEISAYQITPQDRAQTIKITTNWVQEHFGWTYRFVKVISVRAEEVALGVNFYTNSLFRPKGHKNKFTCESTLQRRKHSKKFVREYLHCFRHHKKPRRKGDKSKSDDN